MWTFLPSEETDSEPVAIPYTSNDCPKRNAEQGTNRPGQAGSLFFHVEGQGDAHNAGISAGSWGRWGHKPVRLQHSRPKALCGSIQGKQGSVTGKRGPREDEGEEAKGRSYRALLATVVAEYDLKK